MAVYSVYAPPSGRSTAADGERLIFIKDGPSIPALLFPWAYLLWHRMWLALCVWLVALAVTQGIEWLTSPTTGLVLGILLALWGAAEARNIRGWTLLRRGWTLEGVVEGGDLETAERRFLTDWLGRQQQSAISTPRPIAPASRPATAFGQHEVIGLFPFNGDRP